MHPAHSPSARSRAGSSPARVAPSRLRRRTRSANCRSLEIEFGLACEPSARFALNLATAPWTNPITFPLMVRGR